MNKDILEKIGLSKSEKKIYLALLDLGDSTRGKIVNTSGVSGSKVYDVLEKLKTKGLVSVYLENSIKHFKPTNPKQILTYLDEQEQKIISLKNQTEKMLPNLLAKFNSSKKEKEVELITGLKGLEIIFREQIDLLQPGEINYVIGGTKGEGEKTIETFFQKIHSMREKKKIKTKMLYNINQRQLVKEAYSSKQYPNSTTKFIEHSSPVSINVYQDRTIIIIFGGELTAISIKSQDVANSFIEYFNILWKSSKK